MISTLCDKWIKQSESSRYMHIEFLLNVFNEAEENDSIIWNGTRHSYRSLIDCISGSQLLIDKYKIEPGAVVALVGDFSPSSIALLLALIENLCIVVPLKYKWSDNYTKQIEIAQVDNVFRVDENDVVSFEHIPNNSNNRHYDVIRDRKHPGLVLFTSGTSGQPKAAVHDVVALLEKFKANKTALRTLNFLFFDHWGGLNTLFHILSSGGTVIATKKRTPDDVCELINKYKIELLPASPTFLNLLLLGDAHKKWDLSSLRIISYGTEPMPQSTLQKLRHTFPSVKLLQTYGLIELGVMRSQSESNESLWVKLGGEGYETRVVDGMLEVKARSAMLGYINSKSPFTDDGWFRTGDMVLQKGDYIKILGRESDIINVGGEKVYPQEIENVIQELDNVAEVVVYGEKNSITGNIVCAKVRLLKQEDTKEFRYRLRKRCNKYLSRYMVPVKITIGDTPFVTERFKKIRKWS